MPGDVVTAAEIEPFHLVQKIAEIALDDFQRFREGVCVLFAEGVEMQSVDACEICSMQRVSENAEAASFYTGIVDGVVLGGMHRIDAQSCAFSCCKDALLEMIPLGEAVEHDVVGVVQKARRTTDPDTPDRKHGSRRPSPHGRGALQKVRWL